jgi:hypothetical protein
VQKGQETGEATVTVQAPTKKKKKRRRRQEERKKASESKRRCSQKRDGKKSEREAQAL